MNDHNGTVTGPEGERIDVRAHGDPEGESDSVSDIEQLVATVKTQQESIAALADHVGALVQCVAMLLGEEMGTPVAESPAPAVETDWDGNPIE